MTKYEDLPMSVDPTHFRRITEELTRLRTALAESEAMRGRQMKTIDEMRGTIRVLGEEVAEWQKVLDGVTQYDGDRYTLLREKIKARNADPAARAAVEGKQ